MEMFWSVLFVCVFIVQVGTETASTTTNTTEPAQLTTGTIVTTHVTDKTSAYIPQTFKLNNIVSSGPILLFDKKSLYIPTFRYNGDHKNVHFWVGNGSTPSSNGTLVPDESGSLENLHSYQGQNLKITLPKGITTDNIEYFGVWSIDEQLSLGDVPIKGIKDVPEASNNVFSQIDTNTTGNFYMPLPKCCPHDSILTVNGCEQRSSGSHFKPQFKVYQHNDTHFYNISLDVDSIHFLPYISAPKCENGKFPLDDQNDGFALLQNTSLLVKGPIISAILLADHFCLENIEESNDSFPMNILVCAPEYKIEKAMFITYVTLTIISTFCLAITCILYVFWLKVEDVHRKCFTGYVFTMMVTFLSLTIVQTTNVENGGCGFLGFIFQIFMIASFTLLGILCFDILIIIKYIDEKKCLRLRKRWYLGIAIGVPLLFLIISLARNLTPDVPNSFFKPQYLRNSCAFNEDQQRTIIFYVPICLSMAASTVFLAWSKYIIVQNDREESNNYFWFDKGTLYKFMWRKYLIIFVTSFLWALETLLRMQFANTNMLIAIDIVEASQGILVLLLFIVNKQTRTEIYKIIEEQRKKRSRRKNHHIREEEFMLDDLDFVPKA